MNYTEIHESFTSDTPKSTPSISTPSIPTPPIPTTNSYRFLNKADAASLFTNFKYLDSMNSCNLNARKTSKNTVNQQYINSILDILTSEKDAFNQLLNLMYIKLDASGDTNANRCKKFIKYMLENKIIIAKASEWLENGMPHTHKNVIFFQQQWFNEISNSATYTNYTKLQSNGATLCHEIMHIMQRIESSKFDKLYEAWGFCYASYIDNFNDIESRNRENPDGSNIKWIWLTKQPVNYYWFGAIFKTQNPSRLSEIDYVVYQVYEIDKSRKQFKIMENNITRNICDFSEHRNYFKLSNNHYHPNEIVAEYFSVWYKKLISVHDINNILDAPAYLIFESWLLSNIL